MPAGGAPAWLRRSGLIVAAAIVLGAVALVALVAARRPDRPRSDLSVTADAGLLAWDGHSLWRWQGSRVCTPGGKDTAIERVARGGTPRPEAVPLQALAALAANRDLIVAVGED